MKALGILAVVFLVVAVANGAVQLGVEQHTNYMKTGYGQVLPLNNGTINLSKIGPIWWVGHLYSFDYLNTAGASYGHGSTTSGAANFGNDNVGIGVPG